MVQCSTFKEICTKLSKVKLNWENWEIFFLKSLEWSQALMFTAGTGNVAGLQVGGLGKAAKKALASKMRSKTERLLFSAWKVLLYAI